MDKIKAFRGVLLCEAFMADIANIVAGKLPANYFTEEIIAFRRMDEILSHGISRGIDKECVMQVKKAVAKVSHKKQTPAQYIATLLNIMPFVSLYLPENLQDVMKNIRCSLLKKCGDSISGEMVSDVEHYADSYLKAVFKDYEPMVD